MSIGVVDYLALLHGLGLNSVDIEKAMDKR
jgi:hypothetical protein